MSFGLDQPAVIRTEVADIVQFWHRGVNAARRFITYSVETGMGAGDSLAVLDAQIPLLEHLTAEMSYVYEIEETLTESDQRALSTFRHDDLNRELQGLRSQSQTAARTGSANDWLSFASRTYSLNPHLKALFHGIFLGFLAQRNEMNMGLNFLIQGMFVFSDPIVAGRARNIFNNLIENALKYGEVGGLIAVRFNGLDITIQNPGIGMKPKFAASLGKGDAIREGRSEGVNGDGIGWRSIGENAALLGWTWDIKTAPGKGATVTIHTKPGDIVPYIPPTNLDLGASLLGGTSSPAEILAATEGFKTAKPWDGYRFKDGVNLVDVSETPTFKAIQQARMLMERIERKVER